MRQYKSTALAIYNQRQRNKEDLCRLVTKIWLKGKISIQDYSRIVQKNGNKIF